MKKSILFLLPFVVGATTLLTSCGSTKNDENTLNVICLNAGWGAEWIQEAVKIWEKQNPDYKVNLNATRDAKSLITGNIYKSGNVDDVYISIGSDWKRYAGGGRLLELDDLMNETIDGVLVKDKINNEYKNSIYFKNQAGETHTYRLPWTSGIGGIYYNKKMFRDNNWEVPTTYEELVDLCEQIIDEAVMVGDDPSETVYPFSYTGANTDYFDYTVFTWWSQISGVDAITEFKKYTKESKDNFRADNPTYAGLKKATEMWNDLFGKNGIHGKVADQEDISRDNHTAQKNFLNGKAAMMFNGDWVYNEMLQYSTTHTLPANFELGIMDTPALSTAQYKGSGYIIGEDQYIAIPKSTIKPELAKSFVKTLMSDQVIKTFSEKAHGLLAFKLSNDQKFTTSDPFVNSLLEYRSKLTSTFTNFSSSPLFLNGYVDFWGASNGRPFLSLINGTSATVDKAFESITAEVNRQWSTWCNNSGM
ncbi:MAG: extracellular solute-binding protein [Bacilli bacterium]|nr:extracellular solute-binding protein [Bacilli bacterium]